MTGTSLRSPADTSPDTSTGISADISAGPKPTLPARALRLEWLGQTVASLCWIASVFVYGISSTGDWLQLAAATSWLAANVAALLRPSG